MTQSNRNNRTAELATQLEQDLSAERALAVLAADPTRGAPLVAALTALAANPTDPTVALAAADAIDAFVGTVRADELDAQKDRLRRIAAKLRDTAAN